MPYKLLFLLIFLISGCSVLTVSTVEEDQPHKLDCTQSNWAAGVDLVIAAGGGAATAIVAESGEPWHTKMTTVAITSAAVVSMLYGFVETADCRSKAQDLGLRDSGGKDWVIAPSIALFIGGAVALASGGGKQDPDACDAGDRVTAICNDGEVSCSKRSQGTCSWHGGVRQWL